jgi:hypothetical protein
MPARIRRTLPSLLAAAALVVAGLGSAVAQPEPAPQRTPAARPGKATKPATKPVKVKVLTIDDAEDIEAGVPTGQIIPVAARGFDEHTSLIRVRRSFVDMILKDAENL